MKNSNLLYRLRIITGIVFVLMGTFPIIALIERKKIAFEFIFPLMLFAVSLHFMCSILKSIDERLSDIEARIGRSDT